MMARNTVTINGVEYSKCVIPDKKYQDCATPCSFCNSNVQRECFKRFGNNRGFCENEQVCYINLNDVEE